MDAKQIETEINALRKAGDIEKILAAAATAMDQLEAAADAPGADRTALLQAAKRIGYNAAADAWPGWEIPAPVRSAAELRAAQKLAQRSAAIAEMLDLGGMQRGNAAWLLGALALATGLHHQAMAEFQTAANHFADAPEMEMRLMTQGYIAITAELSKIPVERDFDMIMTELATLNSEDAAYFQKQLRTAREVFG